ncbi:MAG: 3-oxoacyl-ACP synthase III family protein [Oligoflexus sp.]|jgi:3-oxoacyl-[acyl-carrier-protein] synthase-3
MQTSRTIAVTGTGMYVPPHVVTNQDLEKLMDTSDEWIQQRSGIKERRFIQGQKGPSDLALEAARKALDMAGRQAQEIDLIIFATLSPDYYFPGAGVFLQQALGCGTTPALDIRNQCSGFLYALSTAHAFIVSGQYERILIVGAEVHSRSINLTTEGRDVAVLFGDGAGAMVLEKSQDPGRGLVNIRLHSDGTYRDALKVEYPSTRQSPMISAATLEAGQQFPKMDGRLVFKHAVTRLPEVIHAVLAPQGLQPDAVDHYFFHQANLRINEAVMKQLNQPMHKSFNNIDRYGNCSAASIPMCVDEAMRAGRIKSGDLLCMASFGAGFTWGAALLRW